MLRRQRINLKYRLYAEHPRAPACQFDRALDWGSYLRNLSASAVARPGSGAAARKLAFYYRRRFGVPVERGFTRGLNVRERLRRGAPCSDRFQFFGIEFYPSRPVALVVGWEISDFYGVRICSQRDSDGDAFLWPGAICVVADHHRFWTAHRRGANRTGCRPRSRQAAQDFTHAGGNVRRFVCDVVCTYSAPVTLPSPGPRN